eukprot:gene18088-18327_t
MTAPALPQTSFHQVREALLARQEIALLDVREEDPFAQSHPLFAANLPAGKIELEAWTRIPRRDTFIVVYDNGEGLAEPAARKLQQLGYTQVTLLAGGLQGWRDAGGELFIDVNVPSKSFGELVEAERHTPSLAAEEVQTLIDAQADVVVLDARRYDEYHTMNIPTGVSVPGAELVLRAQALAPNPATQIIVNCAGRTRSIIGTQSLVNAGIPNPVAALRNGTIGWTLAGQQLEHGSSRRFSSAVSADDGLQAAAAARSVADRAGVKRLTWDELQDLRQDVKRTTYLFDVRTPQEYESAHVSGFVSAPGGQLVQETEVNAPVRGARIVLLDDDGVRANMTASWLAQMGWEVYVLDALEPKHFKLSGPVDQLLPPAPQADPISPTTLAAWLQEANAGTTVVLDFAASANYVREHIPGAHYVLRSQLQQAWPALPDAVRYVLTCGSSLLAAYAITEVAALSDKPVFFFFCGNAAWKAAGLPLQSGETALASPRIDRYRRPYEAGA